MNLRSAFFLTPLCLFIYGIIRLIDGLDGSKGPGIAWTVGHIFFLIALVFFGVILIDIYRLLKSKKKQTIVARITLLVAFVGLLTFIRVAIVDLVVGFQAENHAAMSVLSDKYESYPAILPSSLYQMGPLLFQIGLVALIIQLTILHPQRLSKWRPGLVFISFVIMMINLNLLPLAAILLWYSLAPLTRKS